MASDSGKGERLTVSEKWRIAAARGQQWRKEKALVRENFEFKIMTDTRKLHPSIPLCPSIPPLLHSPKKNLHVGPLSVFFPPFFIPCPLCQLQSYLPLCFLAKQPAEGASRSCTHGFGGKESFSRFLNFLSALFNLYLNCWSWLLRAAYGIVSYRTSSSAPSHPNREKLYTHCCRCRVPLSGSPLRKREERAEQREGIGEFEVYEPAYPLPT